MDMKVRDYFHFINAYIFNGKCPAIS
jgi:hypothetical protein